MERPGTENGFRKSMTRRDPRPRTVLSEREIPRNQQRGCSPVLRRTGHHFHPGTGSGTGTSPEVRRPKTAAVMGAGPFTQCERVQQLYMEPTRCPSLESCGPAKRYKAPPWGQSTSPLVPFLAGPGYILSRGKNKYDVKQGTCSLELTPREDEQSRLKSEEARESLISQLQQQISDLNLFLEEERLNHRQTKQKAEEYLRDRLDQLQTQHNEHTREVKARHKEEALKQKTQLDSEFTEFQTNTENHIRKLAKEVEHLQGAFEAYKSCLQDEMHAQWLAMEQRLKKDCDQAVQAATQDMKTQLTREKAADRTEAVKEQRRTIDALRKEHKRDMDNVFRKYSKEAAEMERLQKTTAELTEVKKEVEAMKTRYQDSSDKLMSATRHLTDMKVQLMDFEQRFQEKVAEVNAKYKDKLQDLMAHNSQLRLLYMDKCGQLFEEQTNTTARMMLQVKAAKAAMESVSDPNHTTQDKESGAKLQPAHSSAKSPRPTSAPGTPRETEAANLSARETEHPHREVFHAEHTMPPDNSKIEQLQPIPDVQKLGREDLLNTVQV